MEIRHLRCFMALAEELHFARAAAKLHIEQSPLSRTIKELEEELGAQLFIRNTRSTRLTRAGLMLMEHAPRVFASLQQARDCVKAAKMAFMDNSASPCQTAQHYCAYQPYWRCVARRSPRLRFAF